ncbi:hypothetical protein EPN54_05245 [bacterium]|nr:MAG: hypothetical protein EPN54_05245 [bacterium]
MKKPDFLRKIKANEIIDNAGLLFLGLVSLGYVLFYRPFAKLHINLPGLNIPIFIGEILFLLCAILAIPKIITLPKKIINLLIAYAFFIIVKTLIGYINWGPLSFRHAALFYYPLFAVFSYSFFKKGFFNNRFKILLIVLFLFIFKFLTFYYYFILTCSILTFVLIRSYPKREIRYLCYFILLLVFPYRFFFDTARTFMVSNFISLLFILIGFLLILKLKKSHKVAILFLFVAFIVFGAVKIANKDHLKSLIGIGELQKKYKARGMLISERKKHFVARKYEVNLYNPDYEDDIRPNLKFGKIQEFIDQRTKPKNEKKIQVSLPSTSIPEASKSEVSSTNNAEQLAVVQSPLPSTSIPEASKSENTESNEQMPPDQNVLPLNKMPEKRDLETDYANSLFRIFIWQDALNDIMNYKPVFGFDFGKPFLSHSLQVTKWAISDWGRDGWVCFHNGYIDILYRSGVLSIIFFIFILGMLLIMVRKSFQVSSINGILLTGILINWFVAANFLEILEMPYTAIPLWSLFGITFAYLFKNETT